MKKLFSYFYFIFFMLLFTTKTVHAYIDPSVMTYAIQAVAGVAIGLGAFFGIYWRKFKRFVEKKLAISLRDKKGESDDLYIYDETVDDEPVTPSKVIIDDMGESGKQTAEKKEKFSERFLPSIILTLALAFMLVIYAPLELYFTNEFEFWYDFPILFPCLIVYFIIFVFAGIIAFAVSNLLYDRFHDIVFAAVLDLYICSYIQGNYLVKNLPPMDGSAIVWSQYINDMIQSFILWIIVTVIIVLAARFVHTKGIRKIALAMSVLISAMLTVSLFIVSAKSTTGLSSKSLPVLTNKNIFTMSSNKNLVVFVVDAMDGAKTSELFEKNPEYTSIFSDFTYYDNMLGAYPYTRHGVPFLLNGQWHHNEMPYYDFEAEAMQRSPILNYMRDEGYQMGFYEDYYYDNSDYVNLFDNTENSNGKVSSRKMFGIYQAELVWFRYAPFFMKMIPNISDEKLLKVRNTETDYPAYSEYNTDFLHLLEDQDVTIVDSGCFRFIHIEGAHSPFRYDKDVNVIPEEEGSYDLNMQCAFTLIQMYLNKLKESGVYDNTAIVITADHGYHWRGAYNGDVAIRRTNPAFWVKGINESHEEMYRDSAPVSFDDVQQVYLRLMDGKNSSSVFDWKEGDERIRKFIWYQTTKDNHMVEYEQHGWADNIETLIPTGNVYDIAN